ncbi:MAG TPA: 3-dehydroquinate synthase [Phycisphaerales bacterium]|mgnify:CR=1 FL=1|nr:3-dehydroquinate synthase [Phycisphaerales bacterium]HMP36815.1 3-dehydroquinate synthase [Phycisphaerales bacterium]
MKPIPIATPPAIAAGVASQTAGGGGPAAAAGVDPSTPGGGKLPWPAQGGAAPIQLQAGLLGTIGSIVRKIVNTTTTLLVVDEGVAETHGPVVVQSLAAEGFAVGTSIVKAEESLKTMETVARLYGEMLACGVDRESVVVVLGGGTVGDIGGFAAATYMRGVATVLVPTTLLAMVDASIGGKTGVNLPLPGGTLGKNLAGAFWPPRAIIDDPETLRTLPARELRCGLAECVKHALIGDPDLIDYIESRRAEILALETESLTGLLARSIAVKARIVAEDPYERSSRAQLNLGHTFGHAIEPEPALGLRHGEAVSIGLCAAMRLARLRGMVAEAQVRRVERLLDAIGLPTRVPPAKADRAAAVDRDRVLRAMRVDKKNRAGRIRLVLPDGIGRVRIIDDVPEAEIREAWEEVGMGR